MDSISKTSGALGRATGWAIAPVFALVSFARKARTFHPRGPVFHAVLAKHPQAPAELADVADRLVGHALVRFSGALWKRSENLLDVLGCAIRVRRSDRDTAKPEDDDQDLLFATIRRPWTMFFSPLTTNVRDYLGNDYFAVSPFAVGTEGPRLYFQLHPAQGSSRDDGTRAERLAREVLLGRARMTFSVSEKPFGPWTPLLELMLERPARVDGEALQFRPFRTGRGIEPRGFIHGLRLGVYALSQRARPTQAGAPRQSVLHA